MLTVEFRFRVLKDRTGRNPGDSPLPTEDGRRKGFSPLESRVAPGTESSYEGHQGWLRKLVGVEKLSSG